VPSRPLRETRGSVSSDAGERYNTNAAASSSRKEFLQASSILGFTAAVNLLAPEPAFEDAATLEKHT
jgi:hypothetical protein